MDEKFGPALPLQRDATDVEMSVMPRSFQPLSKETAPALKAYMECAGQLFIPRVFHATTPILWLIDHQGVIRFALEEVLMRDTGHLSYVLPRNGPPLRDNEVRLGHPALLDPVAPGLMKYARIAGEIIYDPVPQSDLKWVLTNNSGRFGKRPHITRQHLENASAEFRVFEIYFRTFFIYTPNRTGEVK